MHFLEITKLTHILGGLILLNFKIGITFFIYSLRRKQHESTDFLRIQNLMLFEMLVVAPTMVLQPISGGTLIYLSARDWAEPWLLISYVIYSIAVVSWVLRYILLKRMNELVSRRAEGHLEYSTLAQRPMSFGLLLSVIDSIAILLVFYLMLARS